MLRKQRKSLALALAEKSILVVEITEEAKFRQVARIAEFHFPDDLAWDKAVPLGQAFAEFLKQHDFKAKSVQVGVPASWLLSAEKLFPLADRSLVPGMVALEVEKSFALGSEQLLFDYLESGGAATANSLPKSADATSRARVFMVGIHRRKYDAIMSMLKTIGFTQISLTPGVLPLAMAAKLNHAAGLILLLRHDRVEIVLRSHGGVRLLRHLSLKIPVPGASSAEPSGPWLDQLASQVQANLANSPGLEEVANLPVLVCNETVYDDHLLLDSIGRNLAMPAELIAIESLPGGEIAPQSIGSGVELAPAAIVSTLALALAGSGLPAPKINFCNSRMISERTGAASRNRNRMILGAAIMAVILILLLVDWYQARSRLLVLREQAAAGVAEFAEAEEFAQLYRMWLGWTGERPLFLEPLRALTMAMPTDQPIWVTNLMVREDRQMIMVGKTNDERTVLLTLDKLRQSPQFRQAKLLYLRETGGETTFSISIAFNQ